MEERQLAPACFAPNLSDDLLKGYAKLARDLPHGELKDAFSGCLRACEKWWDLPESSKAKAKLLRFRHRGKDVDVPVQPLDDEHVKELWDLVPWPKELAAVQSVFDEIPANQKALRDAAFHLLWHVKELSLDREPLTQDKLS